MWFAVNAQLVWSFRALCSCLYIYSRHKWIRHVLVRTLTDNIRCTLWSGPNPNALWLCICYAAVNKCNCESHGLNNQSFPQCVNPLASGSKMVNCRKSAHPTPCSHNITLYLRLSLSVFSFSDMYTYTSTNNTLTHTHICTHTHFIPQCEGLLQPSPRWM